MWKATAWIVALALLTPEAIQMKPRSLLAAADAGPVSFVEALASNHRAAGLIAPESVFQMEHNRELAPALTEESVEESIARFNARPHGYQASVVAGVALLSPRSCPAHVQSLLQRQFRASGRTRSMQDALMEITRLIEPEWGKSGVIGTGPVPPQECQQLLDRNVTLRGSASVQELLGSVARQAPGVSWMLLYDEWDTSIIKLGFVCPNGLWRRWTIVPK
jgi:hypothetical protein